MTNRKQILEQRFKDLRVLNAYLSRLPLSYMENMRLRAIIKRYPLEALLTGRSLQSDDNSNRVHKWVREAIERSPHLNN